jgi:aminomethyltransferase
LVINAGCKKTDVEHLRDNLDDNCELELLENRSLIALQGPKAEKVLSKFSNQIIDMFFMDTLKVQLQGFEVWISRSGYTGEDGFEISIPNDNIIEFTEQLLEIEDVLPIGLGARDSLRLEAGLCLYGHDIDQNSSPTEAGLNWAISKKRRANGTRSGNFLGSERILNEISNGTDIKRVGIVPIGRAPMREGVELFKDRNDTIPIGKVTSGGFGPIVERAISMGYLDTKYTKVNTKIFAEIRGKRMEAVVTSLPFTKLNFKRSN